MNTFKNRVSRLLGALLPTCAALVVLMGVPSGASALTLTVERLFDGNDCAGFFGQPFSACTIFINSDGDRFELSPVIAKFDNVDGGDFTVETNSGYPSIDGSEFLFTDSTPDGNLDPEGTWVYAPNDATDPGVKYWATKAGNEFLLSWVVDETAFDLGGACDVADPYSLDCLNAAQIVTTADWITPLGPNDLPRQLSHITFYDSIPVQQVAEPAISALLGLGLVMTGWFRGRRYAC